MRILGRPRRSPRRLSYEEGLGVHPLPCDGHGQVRGGEDQVVALAPEPPPEELPEGLLLLRAEDHLRVLALVQAHVVVRRTLPRLAARRSRRQHARGAVQRGGGLWHRRVHVSLLAGRVVSALHLGICPGPRPHILLEIIRHHEVRLGLGLLRGRCGARRRLLILPIHQREVGARRRPADLPGSHVVRAGGLLGSVIPGKKRVRVREERSRVGSPPLFFQKREHRDLLSVCGFVRSEPDANTPRGVTNLGCPFPPRPLAHPPVPALGRLLRRQELHRGRCRVHLPPRARSELAALASLEGLNGPVVVREVV
mmetsp:Transcript_68051/g.215270  ORF Transcript_68051/g.215270 Transcript_68051/m.215270 type:complete len:311 (+) Transcript_68051:225-1157(+)